MAQVSKPNIAIKANIWSNREERDSKTPSPPYFLQEKIPGDLLIEFMGTRDVREIERELTPEQYLEYQQARFFQRHGQEGIAFEP